LYGVPPRLPLARAAERLRQRPGQLQAKKSKKRLGRRLDVTDYILNINRRKIDLTEKWAADRARAVDLLNALRGLMSLGLLTADDLNAAKYRQFIAEKRGAGELRQTRTQGFVLKTKSKTQLFLDLLRAHGVNV